MTIAALIVAGGRGRRFGGELPKQYRMLAGKPVLRHAIDAFLSSPLVDRIQVVIRDSDRAHYDAATRGLALLVPVAGGDTRQASVRSGLEALATNPPASVLIHDAARPFLSTPMIAGCAAALNSAPGAIVAVPLRDTLKRGSQNNEIAGTVDRNSLWRAQTPQAFRREILIAAYEGLHGRLVTDEASAVEIMGKPVMLIDHPEWNVKVTYPKDLPLVALVLSGRLKSKTE